LSGEILTSKKTAQVTFYNDGLVYLVHNTWKENGAERYDNRVSGAGVHTSQERVRSGQRVKSSAYFCSRLLLITVSLALCVTMSSVLASM